MQATDLTDLNKQRSRTIIDGRGRQIILNVNKYFEEEKVQCRMLLQRMTSLSYDKNEVRVPMPIFADVVRHLRSAIQVSKRVAAATLINKNSLTKIKREGAADKASNTLMNTPKKKPRGKKPFFDQDEFNQLESIVKSFMGKKQDFNFKTLLSVVKRDLNYTGSLATLRRILQEMGFQWKKKPGSAFVTFLDTNTSNIGIDLNQAENNNIEGVLEDNDSCTEYEEYLDEENLQSEENYCSEDSNTNMDYCDVQSVNQQEECISKPFQNTATVSKPETQAQNMLANEIEYLLEETDDLITCNSNGEHSNNTENSSSCFAIMQYLKLDPTIDFLEEDFNVDEACSANIEHSIKEY